MSTSARKQKSQRKARKRYVGRFCWSCSRRRPNEQFSRRSGLRGVCRECYCLGPIELAYRQTVRDIDRALRFGSVIPRRQRSFVESFLTHSDPRIRAYANDVVVHDRERRAEFLRLVHEDEARFEAMQFDLPPHDDLNPNTSEEQLDDAEDTPF